MPVGRGETISAPSSSGSRDEPNKKSGPKTRSFHLAQLQRPQTVEKPNRVTDLLRRIEDIVAPTIVGMGFELVRVAMSRGGAQLHQGIIPRANTAIALRRGAARLLSGATPQYSRCAPTPSGATKSVSRHAGERAMRSMVSRCRWS